MIRASLVACLLAALAGCDREAREPPSEQSLRIGLLERQIAAGRGAAAAWQPWFDGLQSMPDDEQSGSLLIVEPRRARVMWDEEMGLMIRHSVQDGMLVRLAAELREGGVDLLVVPIPHRSAVYPDQLGLPLPAEPSGLPDFRVREILLELERNGVETVDLVPEFRAGRFRETQDASGQPRVETVYRRWDPHWTAYGAQLAARVLAERIRRYPWFEDLALQQGKAVLADVEPTLMTRMGAVGRRLIAAGELDRSEGRDDFWLYPARIEGERWSLDDPASPIIVIGTSFTLPLYGFTDGLLRELGFRVDRLTVAGGDPFGPVVALRQRPRGLEGKKLVIWVFHSLMLSSQAIAPPPP